jgi:hypothetical protein
MLAVENSLPLKNCQKKVVNCQQLPSLVLGSILFKLESRGWGRFKGVEQSLRDESENETRVAQTAAGQASLCRVVSASAPGGMGMPRLPVNRSLIFRGTES